MEAADSHPLEREHAETLSPWGWLCVFSRALAITISLLLKTAKAVFGGARQRKGRSLYRYVALEGMNDYQSGLSVVGIQNILPSTAWICRRFARKSGLDCSTIHLRDGTTAIRLGSSSPSRVVVFFHGGGYMAPALPEHASLACGFTSSLPAGVAVYVLQYSLTSGTSNHYPRQLQQAVVLFEYLLGPEDIPASSITLVGDSAGGHLALSLLLHLAHPNPRVTGLALEGRLAGAALISPWIISAGPGERYVTSNADKDVLHSAALDRWAQNFLGGAGPDYWSCLLTAPENWWGDLPVDDILITYGDDEIIRDDAAAIGKLIQAWHPQATAMGYAGELHEHMVMNRFLRINEPCASELEFCKWLSTQLNDGAQEAPRHD